MVSLEKRTEHNIDDVPMMTADEVAAFFRVGVGAVRRWTRSGKLKGHKLGGNGDWRYLKKDVMQFFYGN